MTKLQIGISQKAGRNNQGVQTIFTQGGGVKRKYRFIDFSRSTKDFAFVKRIERDPNRSAFIALISYSNGAISYIIAIEKIRVGSSVHNCNTNTNIRHAFDYQLGNSFLLGDLSTGSLISSVELYPGNGAVFARAAGTCLQIIKKFSSIYTQVKLRSGEHRLLNNRCIAVLGVTSNIYHNQKKLVKAGQSRLLGIRPKVRGISMNPVDHPHGGRTNGGTPPKTPWGALTKGSSTRKLKKTTHFIIINRRAAIRLKNNK